MIKRLITSLKDDYRRVSEMIHYNCKFKVPEVAILIYYIIMLPIGLVLYPFVKIFIKIHFVILFRRIEKMYK